MVGNCLGLSRKARNELAMPTTQRIPATVLPAPGHGHQLRGAVDVTDFIARSLERMALSPKRRTRGRHRARPRHRRRTAFAAPPTACRAAAAGWPPVGPSTACGGQSDGGHGVSLVRPYVVVHEQKSRPKRVLLIAARLEWADAG